MSRIENAIKISADDVSKLRGCDVYRVLTQGVGYDITLRNEVVTYLNVQRPDLNDEVQECLSDIIAEESGY